MPRKPWNRYYRRDPLVHMGKWSLLPFDCDTWHGEWSSRHFERHFGLPKGIPVLFTAEDGLQHAYAPVRFFVRLDAYARACHRQGLKVLEKKLMAFYPLKERARRAADKIGQKNPERLSNEQLAASILTLRDWIRRMTIFDQMGWLSEERWTARLRRILTKKHRLAENSPDYNAAMFALTKPERISSTLEEKRDVTAAALKVKARRSSAAAEAKRLAERYGWMPVFVYGPEWEPDHYAAELKELTAKPAAGLKAEFVRLKNYTRDRNRDFRETVTRLGMKPADVQEFTDFSLALDGRNEAEYYVSYAGRYLTPLVDEAARRLYLSPRQLRFLYEHEVLDALKGAADAAKIFEYRSRGVSGYGYSRDMRKWFDIPPNEAARLLAHLQKHAQNVQGNDEARGTCASPGLATGKIRIVRSPDQNGKVKDGDILVTYSTTVDYLPAMKRAAAILTEVGGLTCHAAVVSREFGIPCVVALKNAMSKFKDGQTVNVDATAGTVTPVKG